MPGQPETYPTPPTGAGTEPLITQTSPQVTASSRGSRGPGRHQGMGSEEGMPGETEGSSKPLKSQDFLCDDLQGPRGDLRAFRPPGDGLDDGLDDAVRPAALV